MSKSISQSIYFKNLDALRFLSFFSVFIAHTLMLPEPNNIIGSLVFSLFTMNWLLASFFFALSSFLITFRLLAEREKKGDIELLQFYKRRIFRLWPVYYILMAFCFLAIPFLSSLFNIQQVTLPPALPFLLFYVNFYVIEHGAAFTFILLVLWTLSVQEQFYIFWGFVLKYFVEKWLPALIILLFIFSVAFSYYYLLVLHKDPLNLAIHSIFLLQNFCIGAITAYICLKKKRAFLWLQKLPAVFFPAIYIVLILSIYFVKDVVLLNVIKSVCYGFILYDQTFNEKRFFNFYRLVFSPYLVKISYGLYAYHAIIFVLLQKQFHLFEYGEHFNIFVNLLHMFLAFMLTFAIAHFSYKYIEIKFLFKKHPA